MFMVSDAEADRIRAAFARGGDALAALELRRLFPGLLDNEATRESARAIAGRKKLVLPLKPRRIRRRR